MVKLTDTDREKICNEYNSGISIEKLSSKYKIGDRRVRTILIDSGIKIYDSHKSKNGSTYVYDNLSRFPEHSGFVYKAVCITNKDVIFDDYLNKSGTLTLYIKNRLGVDVPSLFLRKKYFNENGKQWYEQYFDIVEFTNQKMETKKCPYCEWETIDVDNKSGMFLTHLRNEHGIDIEQYLLEHPEDSEYFSKQNVLLKKSKLLNKEENYVICPLCGEKMEKITYWHIHNKHNMTYSEFKNQYPNCNVISINMHEQAVKAQTLTNLTVSKKRFISSYERNICKMLDQYCVEYNANRKSLIGKEIDILVNSCKIGIEFDGLKWHTEWFGGKSHDYHLNKTLLCNKNGVGLIHIFEDEYVNSKEIVESKIRHILKIDEGLDKISARKCTINEIYKHDAEVFLNKFHIQGFASSTVYLGAYYNDSLIAVMTFKNGNLKNKCWELTRFAGDYNYVLQGIGGKLFKYFVRKYNPLKIISFADRRWTVDIYNNLYTKIGFDIESINKPDYRYYNDRVDKFKRVHKMYFNKQKLHKKYGFPLTMTETEMAKELGYDRIWDCGLIKYVWKNQF